MTDDVHRTAEWVYQGVWGILARWFRVPRDPPKLPVAPGDTLTTLRPSVAWMRYLKLQFWIGVGILNVMLTGLLLVVLIAAPLVGIFCIPLWAVFVFFPNALGFMAVHLRFDSTWYVLTSRSMRIRRGIWVLHETTITYENVQNVTVSQGPLERYFGIANVVVQTAGGGGAHGPHGAEMSSHVGLLEGLSNAHEIRELILQRVRQSGHAGLGDEAHANEATWRPDAAHVQALREIRDAMQAAVDSAAS